MTTRSLQIEAITNSLAEPIAEAILLNSPQGADIADVMADVKQNIYEHLTALRGDRVNELVIPHEPKLPKADLVAMYHLKEPIQIENPADGLTYEVPPKDYPVMAKFSDDRKAFTAAAIIWTGTNRSGEEMDIVKAVRPVDIPAMVQRREIVMEKKHDNDLAPKFDLKMFASDAPQKKQAVAQAQDVPDQRMRIARSA